MLKMALLYRAMKKTAAVKSFDWTRPGVGHLLFSFGCAAAVGNLTSNKKKVLKHGGLRLLFKNVPLINCE